MIQQNSKSYVTTLYQSHTCPGLQIRKAKIFAYRKDEPSKRLHLDPRNIGFERQYYSQPLPDGSKDNNSMEDLFSTIESSWPPIVQRMRGRLDINPDLQAIFMFIYMMRVRVPAARDLYETGLAESVKMEMRYLDELGQLPPKPKQHEDILDHLKVSIDPHRSIHAMPDMVRKLGTVLGQIGFEIVHNETGAAFLTSDNPVVYFDPTQDQKDLRPYTVRPSGGTIELLFPVDSQTVIHGHSELKPDFSLNGIRHVRLTDRRDLKTINRLVARFGYRFIFANSTNHERLIRKYAAESPVLQFRMGKAPDGQRRNVSQQVFGPRPIKPKWDDAPKSH